MTRAGAEALGWGDTVGALEPGFQADVVAVDLDTPHASPVRDPVTSLVYSARASDVRHVLVAGEIRVEDGGIPGLDRREVVEEANRQARSVLDRAAEHGYDASTHSPNAGDRR